MIKSTQFLFWNGLLLKLIKELLLNVHVVFLKSFTDKESNGNRVFRKYALYQKYGGLFQNISYAVASVGMVLVQSIGNAQYSVTESPH